MVVDLAANWAEHFLRLRSAVLNPPENKRAKAGSLSGLTRVDFKAGAYPGISMIEPYPDWSAYNELKMVVYSELLRPNNLVLRVNDYHHDQTYEDRFNKVLTIDRGMNYIHIPLEEIRKAPSGRKMDMKNISEVIFFSAVPAEGLYLYVSDIRLE